MINIPLVLHGGSGSGEKNILNCVKYGINKINVGCDFMTANINSIKSSLKKNPDITFLILLKIAKKKALN